MTSCSIFLTESADDRPDWKFQNPQNNHRHKSEQRGTNSNSRTYKGSGPDNNLQTKTGAKSTQPNSNTVQVSKDQLQDIKNVMAN